jgi:glycosyltransferase involved in cell wall biosynthesis
LSAPATAPEPGPGDVSVLHVITGLNIGGAELALKRLVLSDAVRSRHTVVSLTDIGAVGRDLQAATVAVHALNLRRNRLNAVAFWRFVQLIKTLRPTVIQTWMYHADLFGGLAARVAGRREIVWGIRNTGFAREQRVATIAIMRICALLSHWLPRVIVCCAESARASHVRWGYAAAAMRVIPNGFDLPDKAFLAEQRSVLRASLRVGDDTPVVGLVGRFDPLKDHRNFLRAARIVARVRPDVRFMLVGRDVDDANAQLADWLRELELEGRVALLGERRDIAACYSAMDVFCLSSIHEAFPNVVAEAMASGLPCVVTDVGDAASIVGETGRVVPPRDPERLGAELVAVLSLPPNERRALGGAARHRIETTFSMARTRGLFEAAYVAAATGGR